MQKGGLQRKLPDLAIKPVEPPEYKPPVGAQEWSYTQDYGDGHGVLVVQHIYRNLVVDFAIMQTYDDGTTTHNIARIDCCHGSVHRHVFAKDGTDLVDRDIIRPIIVGREEWNTVDEEFEPCLDKMEREFLENYRRWAK